MKTFCLLAVVIACVTAYHGEGRGGWDQGGWGHDDWGHDDWDRGGDGDNDGDGDDDGYHNYGWQQYPTTTDLCPTTNRIVVISDYIHYTNLAFNCIGTCSFQSNSALSTSTMQSYDKSDSVVIMVGPYSVPNTATSVLSNATLLAEWLTKTNVYLTTIPVYPTVTDAKVISNVAATNALVRTAAATPGMRLVDFKAFYDEYIKYNMYDHWSAWQTCNWMHDQLVAAGVVFSTPAVPAVPAVSAVSAVPAAPAVPIVPAASNASTLAGATLAPF